MTIKYIIKDDKGYLSAYNEYRVAKVDASRFASHEDILAYMKDTLYLEYEGIFTIETIMEVST